MPEQTPEKVIYQRKQYVTNRVFQFKMAFYLVGWLLAITFVYPIILHSVIGFFLEHFALDPQGPDLLALTKLRDEFFWTLVFFHSIFVVIAFFSALLMSHRIAGPLHKLNLVLKKMAKGDWNQVVYFRKKDFFHEIAVSVTQLAVSLQKRFPDAQDHQLLKAQLEELLKRPSIEMKELKIELQKMVDILDRPV